MLLYDHIFQGDTKQDAMAVASIIEAGMMRIRKDIPHAKEIVLLSDSAGCYQNCMLPIMLPFIVKSSDLKVIKFLHTETQDGKSLVDAHFAIAMRHVSQYAAQGNDVTTPSGLVTALRSEGNLANTAAELVKISRSNPNIIAWESLRGRDDAGLAWIGRNNEYEYGNWSLDGNKSTVSLYRYSGMGSPRTFQFGKKGTSKPRGEESNNKVLGVQFEEKPGTNISLCNIGLETGVEVISDVAIQNYIIRRKKRAAMGQNTFLTRAVLETTESSGDEGYERDEISTEEKGIICTECKRRFTYEGRLIQHSKLCKGKQVFIEKTIRAKAIRRSLALMQSNDIQVISTENDSIVSEIDTFELLMESVKNGWARRENSKDSRSRGYLSISKEELQEMFDTSAREF